MATRAERSAAPATSFVGRGPDLRAIEEAWAGSRLVTVLGAPGAGKTRVALEHAARAGGAACFCDLADAHTVLGACQAVGRALGVALRSERAGEDPVGAVAGAIAARGELLLVLDNFEQIARFARETVARWRDASPRARFLVTSRERLGVPGESLVEVGPLDAADAAQLFVQRARSVRPGFAPAGRDADAIAELVRRLDGLPLAIELAGARMAVLGPKQLLERIASILDLLGDRTDRRRSTLRATLEWSWNLLEPHEQSALAQLSTFHEGFMLEAAEAVLELPSGSPAPIDVVQALRERSLLRTGEAPELPGEVRFGLLETIRAFAAEKLEQGGAGEAARERHAAYYLAAAERWAAQVERDDGPEALRRLAVDLANLTAVHRRGVAVTGAAAPAGRAQALRAVLALEHIFYMRGPTSLCLALLDAVLDDPATGAIPPSLLALGLKARGRARKDLGRMEDGARDLERGLALARAAGDRGVEGRILGHYAFMRQAEGRIEEARALLEQAAAAVREAGDARSEGMVLAGLAQVLGLLGRLDDAERTYDEALRIHRVVQNRYAAAFVLTSRAEIHRSRGRPEAARIDLEQGLSIYAEFGERRHEGFALADLASLHQERGRFDEARAAYARALACHREYGSRWFEGRILGATGDLDREAGDHDAARRLYGEALGVARAVGDRAAEARWMLSLASLEGAPAALAEAEALLGEVGSPAAAAVAALHRGLHAIASGDPAAATACLASAAASVEAPGAAPPAELRLARRLLERALSGGAPADAGSLLVGSSGRWFRAPGGERVSLQKRRALRLVLQRFVAQRLEAPGRPLTPRMLLDAGWPGEKVRAEAGSLRVYNALSTLRKLGLRDLLLSRDDGYLLDPAVPTVRVEEAE